MITYVNLGEKASTCPYMFQREGTVFGRKGYITSVTRICNASRIRAISSAGRYHVGDKGATGSLVEGSMIPSIISALIEHYGEEFAYKLLVGSITYLSRLRKCLGNGSFMREPSLNVLRAVISFDYCTFSLLPQSTYAPRPSIVRAGSLRYPLPK